MVFCSPFCDYPVKGSVAFPIQGCLEGEGPFFGTRYFGHLEHGSYWWEWSRPPFDLWHGSWSFKNVFFFLYTPQSLSVRTSGIVLNRWCGFMRWLCKADATNLVSVIVPNEEQYKWTIKNWTDLVLYLYYCIELLDKLLTLEILFSR